MVFKRFGATDFDALPAMLKTGYKENCAKCHGTCGDCHVNRPPSGGGGLYQGHKFGKPNMVDNCIACHVSRGGHAYLGIAVGTQPDVHFTKLGYTCMDCHSQYEVHGDETVYDQRYKVRAMPSCIKCHPAVTNSNAYHSVHIETFSCNTCHSQDYNNCGSCHVAGTGARVPAYQGYKIGMNPIPQTRNYKFATLRRSLSALDTWSQFGVPNLVSFDAATTYKYSSPHNILKWTSRTQVAAGRPCYDNCHIIKEGATLRNKNLYLFQSDLESWEVNATRSITVDSRLPVAWGLGK
jgi:thiosulfate/3-mercaptopyruvate sulfurtransferase